MCEPARKTARLATRYVRVASSIRVVRLRIFRRLLDHNRDKRRTASSDGWLVIRLGPAIRTKPGRPAVLVLPSRNVASVLAASNRAPVGRFRSHLMPSLIADTRWDIRQHEDTGDSGMTALAHLFDARVPFEHLSLTYAADGRERCDRCCLPCT